MSPDAYRSVVGVSSNLASQERLVWLREQLDAHGSVKIAPAAKKFDVSDMTIRRDLLELESLGMARRVRGGAVAVLPVAFEGRHHSKPREKARIAAKVRPLVPGSGAIGIDASSTLVRLATALDRGRELLVITNGWEAFTALQHKPGITATLTGGNLDPRTGSLVGPIANRAAGSLLLNKLFLSAAAVEAGIGSSETTLEEAEVKRAMAAVAGEVILCVDSSKLNTRSIVPVVDWEHISLLVTELDRKDKRLAPYRKLVDIL